VVQLWGPGGVAGIEQGMYGGRWYSAQAACTRQGEEAGRRGRVGQAVGAYGEMLARRARL